MSIQSSREWIGQLQSTIEKAALADDVTVMVHERIFSLACEWIQSHPGTPLILWLECGDDGPYWDIKVGRGLLPEDIPDTGHPYSPAKMDIQELEDTLQSELNAIVKAGADEGVVRVLARKSLLLSPGWENEYLRRYPELARRLLDQVLPADPPAAARPRI